MLSSTSQQYDAKKYPLCAPWDCQRGRSFLENFLPDLTSALGLRYDDFANQQDHLTGNVPGGIPITTTAELLDPATALLVHAVVGHQGGAADIRKSEAQFKNRDAAIIASIRNHIPGQPQRDRIDMIKRLAAERNYEGGAPLTLVVLVTAAAPVAGFAVGALLYPPGHPNDGQAISALDRSKYQKCGNSLARHIIRIIGEEASPDPNAGITQMLAEGRWSNLKMGDVDINASTPRNLATLIKKVALEHNNAGEQQQRIKFLSVLVSPPEIAAKAVTELQRCSTHLQKANGDPDFDKLVIEIQELWDLSVSRGTLKLKGTDTGSRSIDAYALDRECGACSDDDEETYYVNSQQQRNRGLQHEVQCWNCHGFGHSKTECASPRLFRNITEAAKISIERAKSQQSRSADRTIGGAARGRGRGGGSSSSRGGGSARGSQRQPPGHDANLLEDDNDREEGDQYVYSATGERLGTMKTREQFENPSHERFPLGVFGQTDLGADAFNLDLDLDVMALHETDNADLEFAELSPKCFARSAHHVVPPELPELAEYSSEDEDEGEGKNCGGSCYSLSPPVLPQPKSATTCNGKIPEGIRPKVVEILRDFSSKLRMWAQPSQMLSPVLSPAGFDALDRPPPLDRPPSPPPSPPAYYDCPGCKTGVPFKNLCQGQYVHESSDSTWHDVCCYRCPTCNLNPLCPICSPAPAPEPEPEPMLVPDPTEPPGGFPSADELENEIFKNVPGHGISDLPPMEGGQPFLPPKHWRGLKDVEGVALGWGHHNFRVLPMLHPDAVAAWMPNGSGGYQPIGYGGDGPYRWGEHGNHTPPSVGEQAGFWVRNQQRLNAAAEEEAERSAALARMAWRASLTAAASASSASASSSVSVPPAHCFTAAVTFRNDGGGWGGRSGWDGRSSSLQDAAARLDASIHQSRLQEAASLRNAALLSTDPTPSSRPDSPPPESPTSYSPQTTPPESPQATPPESPTSTTPSVVIGVAYLDYSPEPRRHRPSTVWR